MTTTRDYDDEARVPGDGYGSDVRDWEPDPAPAAPAKPRYGYIALYQGRRTELHADSLYAASIAAREFFHPPKSKRHLVSVHLAEIDGETVTQVITS